MQATGEPYAGITVEFQDRYGENAHTITDDNGDYSLKLPDGEYTATALDENTNNAAFQVVGQSDNAVTVPPSVTINFQSNTPDPDPWAYGPEPQPTCDYGGDPLCPDATITVPGPNLSPWD